MHGYEPFQPAHFCAERRSRVQCLHRVSLRLAPTLFVAILLSILPACANADPEPAATDSPAASLGPLGKLGAAPLPPKGQVGLEVSSWILRAGGPGVLDQLASAGQMLPGPAATGLDGVTAGVWSASGFRVFRISSAAWTGIEASFLRTPIAPPVAEGQLPKPLDPNAPSGIIGPRTWMPDGADWTELARGSPLPADQVLALHDGRFRAPASTPRLLARAFSVWNLPDPLAESGTSAGGTPRLVIEIVPQLLGVRRQDADLDLINPRLTSQWSRGQVLERLLGAVTVEAGEVLVITTGTAADFALADGPLPLVDGISRPGRMRSGTAPVPPTRSGLGPSAAPDALGTGSPFTGGPFTGGLSMGSGRITGPSAGANSSSAANLPAEAQAVPTIAQAILAARQAPPEPDASGRLLKSQPLARSFLVLKPSLAGETAKLSNSQVPK